MYEAVAVTTERTDSDSIEATRSRNQLTAGLLLVITLVAFEALAVATVMPSVQEQLGRIELYGWAFSAFLTTSILGVVVAGEQCDRHGPARPFVAALLLFGTGLVMAGLANSMAVVVAGRAVQGLGGGAMPAISVVVVGRGYPASARPRMFALMSSAWVIPSLVGPAAAGFIADTISWRAVFLGLLPLLVVALLLAFPPLRRLGPPGQFDNAPGRAGRALLLVAGFAVAQAGLASSTWWIAGPLLAAGVIVAIRPLTGLLPRGTLTARVGLPAAILGMGVLNFAFFGAEAFVPFMLTNVRDLSVFEAGLGLTIAGLTWTAGSWLQERTHERWGRRSMIRTGFALLGAGIVTTPLVLLSSVPVWLIAGSWAVAGFGMGLAYPSLSILILNLAPPGEEGATTSSFKLAELLSAATGTALAGAIVAAGERSDLLSSSLAAVFAAAAIAAVVGVALSVRLPARR